MKKNKLILISISFIIILSIVIIFVSNNQSKIVYFNGRRFINQNSIVPTKFIGDKIGSKSGYSYYEIRDSSEDYSNIVERESTDQYYHIAVEKEDSNYFYFYKTKDANGINFAE